MGGVAGAHGVCWAVVVWRWNCFLDFFVVGSLSLNFRFPFYVAFVRADARVGAQQAPFRCQVLRRGLRAKEGARLRYAEADVGPRGVCMLSRCEGCFFIYFSPGCDGNV